MIHSVAANIAHRDSGLFSISVSEFRQLASPLLIQFWNRNPDELPIQLWIESQTCVANGFVHGLRQALVVYLDRQQTRLRSADRAQLIDVHCTAIGFDRDGFEDGGIRTPRAQPGEFMPQRAHGAFHAPFHIFLVERRYLSHSTLHQQWAKPDFVRPLRRSPYTGQLPLISRSSFPGYGWKIQ